MKNQLVEEHYLSKLYALNSEDSKWEDKGTGYTLIRSNKDSTSLVFVDQQTLKTIY